MGLKNTKLYVGLWKMHDALTHWDRTKEDFQIKRKIKRYHNIHKNQVCVIVGNGPSLKAEDLSKLHELNIPTFGCNRIHLIFPQTNWRPTYYFISDAKIMSTYADEIDGVLPEHRFFPRKYKDTVKNGVFYNELPFDYRLGGKFSVDAATGIYPAGSVTTEMLQFAYYMGFAEIYLIGVDFNYEITKQTDEYTYEYRGENNHFIKGYMKLGEMPDTPKLQENLVSFLTARKTAEKEGRCIQNATRGGKLEAFERADLDKLIEIWEKRR